MTSCTVQREAICQRGARRTRTRPRPAYICSAIQQRQERCKYEDSIPQVWKRVCEVDDFGKTCECMICCTVIAINRVLEAKDQEWVQTDTLLSSCSVVLEKL
jgi:hypothetical protein